MLGSNPTDPILFKFRYATERTIVSVSHHGWSLAMQVKTREKLKEYGVLIGLACYLAAIIYGSLVVGKQLDSMSDTERGLSYVAWAIIAHAIWTKKTND